jgi:hypothetical protein
MDWQIMAEQNTPAKSVSIGHELSDVYPKNILWFGIGLALVIGAVVLVSYGCSIIFIRVKLAAGRLQPAFLWCCATARTSFAYQTGADLAALRADEDEIPRQLRLDRSRARHRSSAD